MSNVNPWEYPGPVKCATCREEYDGDDLIPCPTCDARTCLQCWGDPFCKGCMASDPCGLRIGDLDREYTIYWEDYYTRPPGWAYHCEGSVHSDPEFCTFLRDQGDLGGVGARVWDRWQEIVAEQYGGERCLV